MPAKKEFFTCKTILSIMVFLCFMFYQMLKANISIAIVDMISKNNSNLTIKLQEIRFTWSEDQKNAILGCFYWGYLITQIPGGRLSEIYGTKVVLGTSMHLSGILTILTPLASYYGYYYLIVARTSLGLALGMSWPSVPPMAVKWTSQADTSQFLAHTVAASIGAAFTLPLCGFLIKHFGWASAFYVTGAMVILWSVAWYYLVYDSPDKHPRISEEEKNKLNLEITIGINSSSVPWRHILTSKPVWAITIAYSAWGFTFYIILNHLPTYMNDILKFKIEDNGLLSSLPFLGRYFASVASAEASACLLKSKKWSKNFVRKFFTASSLLGLSFCLSIQSVWGYNRSVSVLVFIICLCFAGVDSGGYRSNYTDISPTYAGTISGIVNTFVAFLGYVATKTVSTFTSKQQDFHQWQYIFWTAAAVNVIGTIFYVLFASAEIQTWNPPHYDSVTAKESEKNGINNDDLRN